MKVARLIIDPPRGGIMNMAIDEFLLESACQQDAITLRFYRWSEPTLSLGYFQSIRDRFDHSASLPCRMLRRASGGGAIVHDEEITYSFATPLNSRHAKETSVFYRAFHDSLVRVLAEFGIESNLTNGDFSEQASCPKAFLCFQRHAKGDVVLDCQKVLGSAQRRAKGGVIQHGSLLLRRSHAAPELSGIFDIADSPIDQNALMHCWVEKVSIVLGLEFQVLELNPDELERARVIGTKKFGSLQWMFRR